VRAIRRGGTCSSPTTRISPSSEKDLSCAGRRGYQLPGPDALEVDDSVVDLLVGDRLDCRQERLDARRSS
jgi:hypothetical protein